MEPDDYAAPFWEPPLPAPPPPPEEPDWEALLEAEREDYAPPTPEEMAEIQAFQHYPAPDYGDRGCDEEW